jgi:hypothetical protein
MYQVIDKSPQKAEIAMGLASIIAAIEPYSRGGASSDEITSLLPVHCHPVQQTLFLPNGSRHFQNGDGCSNRDGTLQNRSDKLNE